MNPRIREAATWVIPVAAILLLWHIGATLMAASGDQLARLKLPYPVDVFRTLVLDAGLLLEAALATAGGALVGLAVGTVVGALFGLIMAQARWIEDTTYPYLVAAQMIPTIALAPIILGAVRDPYMTKVIVAAYISVFAVSLGTIKGLKSASRDAIALMATYNASRLQVYRKVRIPAALPFFFAGLKVAAPLAVIGEIVVELAGSKDGLGTLLLTTQYYGVGYAHLFWATMIVTLVLGLLFARAAAIIERIASPWQPEFRGGR